MKGKSKKIKLNLMVFLMLSVFFMELITILFTSGFENGGFFFTLLFSISTAFVLWVITTLFKPEKMRIAAIVELAALFVLYSVQIVYYSVFKTFFIFYSLKAGGADQVIEEGIFKTTITAIFTSLPKLVLMAIPLILLITLGKRFIVSLKMGWIQRGIALLGAVIIHYLCILLIIIFPAPREVYRGVFDVKISASTFGMLRTEWLDMKYSIFGAPTDDDIDVPEKTDKPTQQEVVYQKNVLDIDFAGRAAASTDSSIKSLDEYFAAQEGTYQNKYTGMFEGYNLIYITAEGFSPYAVHPELTPTLYKMANEGFKFNNSYNPIWGVSTSDGEYVTCTGLIPKSGVWSFYVSGENSMPFCMGHQFNRIYKAKGIDKKARAYHNHTYTYYHRDVSHPNMGYKYIGYGNGLEGKIKKTWPESDLEMMQVTVDDYITSKEPFHAYYMTVSGHLNYSFVGNAMSKKNQALVENLNMSDTAKAYLACNIELDRAMEYLLQRLNEAGVAERTLIVINGDHYPYGLLDEESGDTYRYFNEFVGHNIETTFELYKSTIIMYAQGMEPVSVDKYCSSLDIMPTVSNLLGLKYDSRLFMGNDILSTADQLVIFSNRSWISEAGKYDAKAKTFTPFSPDYFKDEVTKETVTDNATGEQKVVEKVTKTAKEVQEDYVANMKKVVNNKFKVSALILEKDYYGKVVNESLFDYSNYKLLDPIEPTTSSNVSSQE
ncbi:MAG: sulfatase-like hydrolase/transferase [Clostridia bacterium]|nr:sulfatase-like hydrolase/transferase [Clostridia bacterium]